ncbi:hypothetical protein V6N11_018817 [Hibiscus sabdariffa]|uniref:Uncharacterized protein n=1 Tax=Hibiscus sabdariffa TaxID=183260 RepID=A0ABR2QTJ7_9ROSI
MDPELQMIANNLEAKHNSEFSVKPDGLLYFKNRMCVPNDDVLRKSEYEFRHSGRYIYQRSDPVTWSPYLHCISSRSEIYFSVLEIFAESSGNLGEPQYSFPPAN